MKILLLGEYSSLYKNLKEGLLELGHDALIASGGDGFKEIGRDIDLSFHHKGGLVSDLKHFLVPVRNRKKLVDYDVVQLINPFLFYYRRLPSYRLLHYIAKHNRSFFLSAAGNDSYYFRYGVPQLRYSPMEDYLKYDLKRDRYFMQEDYALSFNQKVVQLCQGVIPIAYEYEVSYAADPKRLPTIPMPINLKAIPYRENKISNKLVLFHGLIRYGFKGTRHVEEAFAILRKKYPNDLELIIDGNMPLAVYLEVLQRTNVLIDQVYSYSLGMNGNYALAMGKVVMGGAEPESLKSLGAENSPVINVLPTAANIVKAVEDLLENKDMILQRGYESRLFAEKVHDHVKVAQQYVAAWSLK